MKIYRLTEEVINGKTSDGKKNHELCPITFRSKRRRKVQSIEIKYATKTGAPVSVVPAQTKKSRQNLQTAPPSIFDNYKFSNLLVLLKFELVLFRLLDQEQVQSKAYCNFIDFFIFMKIQSAEANT